MSIGRGSTSSLFCCGPECYVGHEKEENRQTGFTAVGMSLMVEAEAIRLTAQLVEQARFH